MADRASASITIGGGIRQSCIAALLGAIELDGGRADWEGEAIDETYVRDGETLEVFAYELPGGIFSEVESFCESHALPFVRSSGSCAGAFGPERVVFRGSGSAEQFDLTEHDEVVLTRCGFSALGSLDAVEGWFASAEFTPPQFTITQDKQVCAASEGASHG